MRHRARRMRRGGALALGFVLGWLTVLGSTAALAEATGQRRAVLVGVNRYARMGDLDYCVADMRALRDQLIASGFAEENIFLLVDGAEDPADLPNRENIQQRIESMLKVARKDDLVLVAFSGHGAHIGGKSYFCPADANLDSPETTMVPVDFIYRQLDASAARQKLLLVDACRNDPRPPGSRDATAHKRSLSGLAKDLSTENIPKGILALSSAAAGQISWEDKTLGHGVFMYYVLEGLSGKADEEGNRDGRVSIAELYDYAYEQTTRWVQRHRPGVANLQTPALTGEIVGPTRDWVLARVARVRAVEEALENLGASLRRNSRGKVIEVNFGGTSIRDNALEHLASLPLLNSVLLNDTRITDAGLAVLGTITTLESIDVRGCAVSNEGMRHLKGLTGLRTLRLSAFGGKPTVDDSGLAALADLRQLRVLALDGLWVGEEGLRFLAGCEKLEEIYLAQTLAGDEAVAAIAQFQQLRRLRISQTQVTDEGLAYLRQLPHLEYLDLRECAQITDAGMASLARVSSLRSLNLSRVAVTDKGMAALARLTDMEWLNLDNTLITDAGLQHLRDMRQLKSLDLGSTGISDGGLRHLERLTELESLIVTRTTATVEGVRQLREKLPNANIKLEPIEGL